MAGLPADAQAEEEHDQGVQVPHGCSVTHIMGWQALQQKAGERQRQQHAELCCDDAARIGPSPC